MKRSLRFRSAAAVLAAISVSTATGCEQWLTSTHAAFFGAGWIIRDITIPTTVVRECFQNNEPVDCDDVS